MLTANYHTHCKYCHHAKGEVKDYVEAAIKNKFVSLGMTDHAPIIPNLVKLYGESTKNFGGNMSYDDIKLYLNDINECKKIYKDQINLYSGFETEYLPKGINYYKELRSKVDYLVLGVHYFEYEDIVVSTYDDKYMNYKTLPYYVDACIKGLETGLFAFLAHPDLFMYHYKNINNERKFTNLEVKEVRRLLDACIRLDIPIEINANGLRSYGANQDYHDWNYPYYEFWDIVKKEYPNIKILIGADAHDPALLNCANIEKVIDFAKSYDFNIINLR